MREADNLTTFMCRMSLQSGSLNLLEPSGPHRDCYETALPCLCRLNALSFTVKEGYIWIVRVAYSSGVKYRGADKSLARPGRKQATATEEFDVHISYL